MITKRRFQPLKVLPYVQGELLLAFIAALVAFALHRWEPLVALPFSIAATLGGALAIFIGFRNNSAYGRWWEARTLWGHVVNESRSFARLVDAMVPEARRQDLLTRQVAFAHGLKRHLTEGPFPVNEPSAIMREQGRAVAALGLDPILHAELQGTLTRLTAAQGGCERILRTPVPLMYTRHNSRFLMIW